MIEDNNEKINQLLEKLDILLKRQDDFSKEINNLLFEINQLKNAASNQKETEKEKITQNITYTKDESNATKVTVDYNYSEQTAKQELSNPIVPPIKKQTDEKSNLEKFIGENLINKIGIAITVIGVAIGAKYSIENNLISPLTRIILGYLSGFGLLAFGFKLKSKYENYSAVLVSGAMAIMYFITYSAYSFYDLIPQVLTFVLMLIFTGFTVLASINYNRQIIALIGLVGAYAVPFLLSDGSGKVGVLFSYMAIINIGILSIAFKKYWKLLYYSSFGLTWVIFFLWYVSEYKPDENFGLALTFLSIFFTTFYLTFLAYKLIQKEEFKINDIILLLSNSFIFYGIGYAILENNKTGEQLLGLFTLINAILHFIVSTIIYFQKLVNRNLFYLISGLVLVFITIAIPVQLNGNWVTLLWAGEAALLFWIGRTKNIPIYEKLSYPLMILAFYSIIQDWWTVYDYYPENPATKLIPLFNINFLTSVLFIVAFGFINILNNNKKYSSALNAKTDIKDIIYFVIPAIFIFTTYYSFRMEIAAYWNQLYTDSLIKISTGTNQYPDFYWNNDLQKFKTIWIINYSLFFVSLLSFVNFKKIRNKQLGMINLALIVLAIALFLIQGLYKLSELRESYLSQTLSEYYHIGIFNIYIRYISFAFVALTLIACYKYIYQYFIKNDFKIAFDFLIHITILWIASSELINWMDIAESTQSYKLGLSILWGIYSLFLIVLGIWKKNKYLRIGSIILFGVTLIKLFFYDISHLDTIAKTIVFVSLGVLLLIISFLYNKYKHIISNENDI